MRRDPFLLVFFFFLHFSYFPSLSYSTSQLSHLAHPSWTQNEHDRDDPGTRARGRISRFNLRISEERYSQREYRNVRRGPTTETRSPTGNPNDVLGQKSTGTKMSFSFSLLFFFFSFRFLFPSASFDSPSKRELAAFVTRNIFFLAYKMYIYILCVYRRVFFLLLRARVRTNERTDVERSSTPKNTTDISFSFPPLTPPFSLCLLFFLIFLFLNKKTSGLR